MGIKTIKHDLGVYPAFQASGNAARFIIPFAQCVCEGHGYDIGCGRVEWALPGAIPIDVTFDSPYTAFGLPIGKVDYIFSSHCLEHVSDWVATFDYWTTKLKKGGVLFLYLPHFSQSYWWPWVNRKHKHVLTPDIMRAIFNYRRYKSIFCSERDLNNSFAIFGEKT